MRIFESYADLQKAMDLPALETGAYRFLPQYGYAGFQCCQCGAVKVFQTMREYSISTGYARDSKNNMFCYDCADDNQRAEMLDRTKPFYGYVAGDGKSLTTWTGGILGQVRSYGESRSGWNGGKIARFHVQDVHGNWWQGRGAGKGMVCTLRPMKKPAYAN